MAAGAMVRKDDMVSDTLAVKSKVDLDRDMLQALTGPEGPLAHGGVPDAKAVTAEGSQALLAQLDQGVMVAQPKAKAKAKARAAKAKAKGSDGKSERVVPLTALEPLSDHWQENP